MDYLHNDVLDRRVSRICLGAAHYGSRDPEDTCVRLLDAYADAGGNFIDTAYVYGAWAPDGYNGGYGNSEALIGAWMDKNGCRERLVIATKGAHPDFATGASTFNHRILEQQLQRSLEHLRTDYVDVYYLHRDDRNVPVDEILGWYREPVEKGVIRALGVCHWRTDRMTEALRLADADGYPRIRFNQIAMSLAGPNQYVTNDIYGEQLAVDDDLYAFHKEHDLPLAAFGSQAQGFYAKKYEGLAFRAQGFPNRPLAKKYVNHRNLANLETARDIARAKGATANQIALAWLLKRPFPVHAITGPRDEAQLADALAATGISLTDAELDRFI